MNDETMKKYIHMEYGVHVFGAGERNTGGDPRYEIPVGWCHMKLRHLSTEPTVDNSWDYGYHGTQARFVLSIIRNRLVIPGTRTADGLLVSIQPGHIPDQNYIFTSPSIHYASHYVYAWPTEWTHGGRKYYVRVVFQIKQKSGTYRISRNTLSSSCWDPSVSFDNYFKNEEVEWVTENPHGIAMEGLLLHFSDIPVRDLVKRRELARKDKHVEKPLTDERREFQYNLDVTKKKILWVDDNPTNNLPLILTIEGCKVDCVCRRTTDLALKELREHGGEFFAIITDLVRDECREGDPIPKKYYEAGIDFTRAARGMGVLVPIFMYSMFCRQHRDLCRKALDAGVTKVMYPGEIKYLIRRG